MSPHIFTVDGSIEGPLSCKSTCSDDLFAFCRVDCIRVCVLCVCVCERERECVCVSVTNGTASSADQMPWGTGYKVDIAFDPSVRVRSLCVPVLLPVLRLLFLLLLLFRWWLWLCVCLARCQFVCMCVCVYVRRFRYLCSFLSPFYSFCDLTHTLTHTHTRTHTHTHTPVHTPCA